MHVAAASLTQDPLGSSPVPVPTLVSLFSGAGGLDAGLERAGLRTVTATDSDPACISTLQATKSLGLPLTDGSASRHLEHARLLAAQVEQLSAADLVPYGSRAGWRPDLLAGGPPCQPFSSAGLQLGIDDPRGGLFLHFVRLAEALQPRVILFENVRGLVTTRGPQHRPGEVLELVLRHFREIGYSPTVALLNAADYGAAQRRVRFFMVAVRDGEPPAFPEPTHSRSVSSGLLPWVTLAQALDAQPTPAAADIVVPSAARAAALADVPDGKGLRSGGHIEGNRPGGHWGYRQDCFIADQSLPSRTIRAATTPDFVRRDELLRRLTWRECAALQGFPEEWAWQGTVTSRFRQVGNAVNVNVGAALGHSIVRWLSEARPALAVAPYATAELPANVRRAIRYTEAEDRVNAAYRRRARLMAGTAG